MERSIKSKHFSEKRLTATKPKPLSFFKYGYLAGAFTNLSRGLQPSINTLLVALGANPLQISIINSVKFVGRAIYPFYGLKYINWFVSRRKAHMIALTIGRVLQIFFALIAFLAPEMWFFLILGIMFLQGVTSRTTFLTYLSWMGEIVPRIFKNRFFAYRSALGELLAVLGYFISYFIFQFPFNILHLIGWMFLAAMLVRTMEIFTYFFHPESQRKLFMKNHILSRIKTPFREKKLLWFTAWYNFANVAAVVNILFLEYFIIRVWNLSYYWIPLSFVLFAAGSVLGSYALKMLFERISYFYKLNTVSFLVLLSSLLWFATDPTILWVSLILAGFVKSGVKLSQRVEIISYANDSKDKEAIYSFFDVVESVFSSAVIAGAGLFQVAVSDIFYIFIFTSATAMISIFFIRYSTRHDNNYLQSKLA